MSLRYLVGDAEVSWATFEAFCVVVLVPMWSMFAEIRLPIWRHVVFSFVNVVVPDLGYCCDGFST